MLAEEGKRILLIRVGRDKQLGEKVVLARDRQVRKKASSKE